MRTLIAPSILSADFAKMGEQIKMIEKAGADIVHCDVMDGVFVPNITFGLKMISDIKKETSLPLDVHLMIVNPEKYVERFADAGADYITFHYEASSNESQIIDTLNLIKSKNVKAGLVINPDTDVKVVENIIKHTDMILLMSVFPGFGGQKFIENSCDRLAQLKEIRDKLSPNTLIEIDGGITFDNAEKVVKAGADILVAGNTVFSHDDKAAAIELLRINK